MEKSAGEPESFILTRWLFFRLMGLIHLCGRAFGAGFDFYSGRLSTDCCGCHGHSAHGHCPDGQLYFLEFFIDRLVRAVAERPMVTPNNARWSTPRGGGSTGRGVSFQIGQIEQNFRKRSSLFHAAPCLIGIWLQCGTFYGAGFSLRGSGCAFALSYR